MQALPVSTARQFVLLVIVNSFVGGMVGLERTVLPLLAEEEFGIASRAATLAFIATFGAAKALMNLFAGRISERWGRRRILVAGWILGLPVPLIIMAAPRWSWILAANVLLGVQQAMTWSMTLVMKVDLVHPARRGLAVGLNEFAGYTGLALMALASGAVASRFGLRPEPFYLGLVLAAGGLLLSLATRETRPVTTSPESMPFREIMKRVSWSNPGLSAASAGGLAVNLKDGVLWGLLPILLHTKGLSLEWISVIVALYPAVWGFTQVLFGSLSDHAGRKYLIVGGLGLQALGVSGFILGTGVLVYVGSAVLAGLGTAMTYPVLIALVSDESRHGWRATALGVYRFWRDFGYVVGAVGIGVVADTFGLATAFGVTSSLLLLAMFLIILRVKKPRIPRFG